ncbi:hypothetical protein ACTFIR_003634 [Dictyostelium discoideum]
MNFVLDKVSLESNCFAKSSISNFSDETAALLFQKYRGAEVSGLLDTKSVEGICSEIKKSDQQKNKLFDKYTTKQMATKVSNMKKLFDDNNQPHSTSSKLNNSFNHNLQDDIDSKLEEEYINSKRKSSTPNPNTHKIPKAVMNKRKKSMVDSNDEEIPEEEEEEEELSDNTQDEVDEEFKYSDGSPTSITGNITKILSGELKGYHTPVRGNTKSNNNNNNHNHNHNNNKHKYNNNDDELNNLKREILQLRNQLTQKNRQINQYEADIETNKLTIEKSDKIISILSLLGSDSRAFSSNSINTMKDSSNNFIYFFPQTLDNSKQSIKSMDMCLDEYYHVEVTEKLGEIIKIQNFLLKKYNNYKKPEVCLYNNKPAVKLEFFQIIEIPSYNDNLSIAN